MNEKTARDAMEEAARELGRQSYKELKETILGGQHAEVHKDADGQPYYEQWIDGELRRVYLGPGEEPPLVHPRG